MFLQYYDWRWRVMTLMSMFNIYKKKHIALERHNRNNLALNQGNLETEKKNTSNGTRWKEFRIRGCRLQISAEHYGGNRWGKHPNIQCHLAQSWALNCQQQRKSTSYCNSLMWRRGQRITMAFQSTWFLY